MNDVSLEKIIVLVTMVDKSIGSPLNHKMLFRNSMIMDLGAMEELKSSLWEQDHPEMEIYETYTKGPDFTSGDHNDTVNGTSSNHNVDSWSLVLYLICFVILIFFFLLISILEVCCKRGVLTVPAAENQTVEVPPPPYDLFGPPTYDSLYDVRCQKKKKTKGKCSVFVIHLPKRRNIFDLGRARRENESAQDRNDVTPPPPP